MCESGLESWSEKIQESLGIELFGTNCYERMGNWQSMVALGRKQSRRLTIDNRTLALARQWLFITSHFAALADAEIIGSECSFRKVISRSQLANPAQTRGLLSS